MTTNLKIPFEKNSLGLTFDIDDFAKSNLTIKLEYDIQAWNNVKREKGVSFPVSSNSSENKTLGKIYLVKFTGSTDFLTTIYHLLLLKEKFAEDDVTQEQFQIVINKDLGNQNDHWNITDEGNENLSTLWLSEADFGGSLDESKFIIDDVDYKDTEIELIKDYSNEKQALFNLEKLLNETLPKKYTGGNSNIIGLDLENGPEIKFIDPSVDLGKPAKDSQPATGLFAYSEGTDIKNTLYNLNYYNGNKVYQEKINAWINYLKIIKSLNKSGITKSSELFIFFYEGYNENDSKEIKKSPGSYKGFPLLDPNLKAVLSADNKFKVEKKDPAKIVRYTKKNIDDFRTPGTGYTGDFHDIFSATKTNDAGVKVFANSDPRDCLGFQPGDLVFNNKRHLYLNGFGTSNFLFTGKSKIYYDILCAQNVEEAMDLAFFGKDYNEPQSTSATREANPVSGLIKNPNLNLQFNEVRIWNRQETLEHYYSAFKSTSTKWRKTADPTLEGEKYNKDDPNSHPRRDIDNYYQLASEWILDYERWTASGFSFASLSEADLKTAKSELERWKGTRFYTSWGVWRKVIDNFLTEVDNTLTHHVNLATELANLKNRGSDLAKKIYENLELNNNGFNKEVFFELKKLVKLLDEAFGTKTSNTETELKKFINDGNSDPAKKKAMEIAEQFKNQESDAKNCVETALEKLQTPQENKLEEARQKLRDLLTNLKIGEDEAYEIVSADIKDSETNLNKASQIFEKLTEIESANNDDNGELLDALNNLKNDASNETAWNAINKYKKDGSNQGYADEMLKKLTDLAEQRKETHFPIKNAKTKTEFQVAKTEFMKKHEYRNKKPDYEEIYFPLLEKAAEIREGGGNTNQEEKDLADTMAVIVSDYSDWKTQLEELEERLEKLRDYAEGGVKHTVIQNYSDVEKTAFKKLVQKMEEKAQEWRIKRDDSNKKNSSDNPSWYKTTAGIVGIIFITLFIFGAIYYYLVKNKDQEEQE